MGRILVTGGNGFVGSHLVEELAGTCDVVSFDVHEVMRAPVERVRYVQGDLGNLSDLKKVGDRLEGIVHLGAISRVSDGNSAPLVCMRTNVLGTMTVLEFARNMADPPWVILGASSEPPVNVYGLSKHISELCVERYAEDYSLRGLALRFASVYGSQRDNMGKLIPKLINRALMNEDIVLSNGKKSFDFIHIRDLINGIRSSMRYLHGKRGGLFHAVPLCTGVQTRLSSLAEIIVWASNSRSRIIQEHESEEESPCLDPSGAEELLGFRAELSIEEGIRRTVEDFVNQVRSLSDAWPPIRPCP